LVASGFMRLFSMHSEVDCVRSLVATADLGSLAACRLAVDGPSPTAALSTFTALDT
jgi:hypothetical protein